MKNISIAVILLCVFFSTCIAETLYVPSEFPTIQAAVDAAVHGDSILISDGLYTGTGNRDVNTSGKTLFIESENGPENCVIDCQASFQDNHRAFSTSGEGGFVLVLRGIKILNGYMPGMTPQEYGGAILVSDGASVIIEYCIFSQNYSTHGGAVYCDSDSSLAVTHSLFIQNTAFSGGAIRGERASSSTIRFSEFQGNSATVGGAVVCFPVSTTMIITDSSFIGGSAESGGGLAISAADGSNHAIDPDIKMAREPGIYTIDNCKFISNSADTGGGILSYFGNPEVTRCVFDSNTATFGGGGIESDNTHLQATNNLFINNTAGTVGGGLSSSGPHGSCIVTNGTFSVNSALVGGAIAFTSTNPSSVLNSIAFNNTADTGQEIALINGYTSADVTIDYSDITGGEAGIFVDSTSTLHWGDDNMDANPLFEDGPLGNYYLSQVASGQTEDSPCVNSGNDSSSNICIVNTYAVECLDALTTRTDMVGDLDVVDLGYHYPVVVCDHDCDPSQDGTITAEDAMLTFQIAMGQIVPTYTVFCSADACSDGQVTALDAQHIFMVALGLVSCGDPIPPTSR